MRKPPVKSWSQSSSQAARLKVEVVRRLVEKEDIGMFEKDFGEGDAHLPAARKLVDKAVKVGKAEAETKEHLLGEGPSAVPARFLERDLRLMMFLDETRDPRLVLRPRPRFLRARRREIQEGRKVPMPREKAVSISSIRVRPVCTIPDWGR